MVDTDELPSTMEGCKENDFKALLKAAEAIASPRLQKGPSKKTNSSPTKSMTASITVANLNTPTAPSRLSLSRIISAEYDEEIPCRSQEEDRKMSSLSNDAEISAASSLNTLYQEDVDTPTCTKILPKQTEAVTTTTSSVSTKMSSNSFKRMRSSEDIIWPFTKKRAPQATKDRKLCSSEGCSNISVNNGVCYRHGAKRRLCKAEGCTLVALQKGVCLRHGAKHPRCKVEGCDKQAQNGGVCRRHGAKVKLCSTAGCTNKARKGGVCIKHGATTPL